MSQPTFEASGGRSLRLVGRRLEISWLRSRLDLCRQGFPHLVLVEGDPGVGKTRLAQELLADTRRAGFRVFTGRCYERLELAYLPLRDSLLSTLAAALEGRPDCEAELALLRRINAGGEEPQAPGGESDERERTRQLLTLTRLVLDQARSAPVAIFVDDLHWSDPATLDLLRHLLFRFDGEEAPVLLLATARVDPQARAAAAVAALQSEPRCATVRLHPLTELEATELVREVTRDASVAQAREVAVTSGGNPLLVQALAREPPASGWPARPAGSARLPHPIIAAVAARVEALTPDARAAVEVVAFLVPHCTRQVLDTVSALSPEALDAAIAEATDGSILTEDETSIGFTHPLYSHVAYEAVPQARRRHVHRQIGTALLASRERGATIPLAAVVHHLLAARPDVELPLITELARRAGDEAMALGAWNEATRFYEAVIEGIDEASKPDEAAALHRLAALCCRCDFALARAVQHLDRAIALVTPNGSAATLAELYLWRIRCGIGSRELLGVVAERGPLEALVEAVEPDRPGLAAQGLVELSQSYWVEGRMAEAEDAARRAMAVAERVHDHVAFSRATMTLSVPQWMRYDLQGSLATLEEGLAQAREADERSALVGGPLFRLPLVLAWLGRFDDAEERALEGCRAADEMHYPLEEGLPLAALAQVAVARGDFDEAERHAEQALLVQRLSGYHWAAGLFLPALAAAHVARGRYTAARDALDTWAETADAWEQVSIALFRRYVDALERPLAVAGAPLARLPRTPAIGAEGWAAAVVEIARREAAPTDLPRARELLAEVDRRGGVLTTGVIALVPRVLGVACDLVGDEEAAIAALDRAIAVARRLRAEPERARAQLDLATILLRRGERDRATDLAHAAAASFDHLGMLPDADRVGALLGSAPAIRGAPGRSGVGAGSELESVTTVLLFTDVVDSTRLCDELGNARYRDLARQLEEVIRTAVVAHGGTIVTGISLGDGLIGLFPSVEQAIAAARACSRDAPSTGLHLHLAVHAGDLIVDGPRIFGGTVNLAARICSISGPDEVLVSEVVRARGADLRDAAFVDRGKHPLKGFAEPQPVFAVVEAASAILG
jgi:class 3 adenylate cyclase/tetratricopeptide (TPR) repeat protein